MQIKKLSFVRTTLANIACSRPLPDGLPQVVFRALLCQEVPAENKSGVR